MKNLDPFFKAKSVVVIGVSKSPEKVGHVVFRNFIDGGFSGKLYIVNPNAEEILGHKAYKSVMDIKESIELGIVAVPAESILKVVDECGKKKIRHLIIITAGFKEIGNYELDAKLEKALAKNKILCVGPNCLGTFDSHTSLDSLFLPRYRLQRPKEGNISFVTQSGAVGSAIMDYATKKGYNFSKFISYGNAMNLDEADILEYLGQDDETKVICMYLEAVHNGKKFIEVAKRVSKKKPIIALKGGVTEAGSKATLSHTGSLAGNADVYFAAFKQAGIIRATSLRKMFEYAKILDKCMKPAGNRVQVITNGGGYGILSTDAIITYGLEMAQPDKKTIASLKKQFPPVVIVSNPMDLIGDATAQRYQSAISACLDDENIDIMLVILLYQTPLLSTDVINNIIEANDLKKKPIIVVSTGGEFTELLSENLEKNNIPCYDFPDHAVAAIRQLVDYYKNNK
jgi:acetyl coenzyme A synthetase (ADP forming)-like protein